MSYYDSYLLDRQLPDNGVFKMLHTIVSFMNIFAFGCNNFIQYLTPQSKESMYYKVLSHSQAISIFICCCIWSILMQVMMHLDYNFFYCEGYYYVLGTNCAATFSFMFFAVGIYATFTMVTYAFRLYLLVDCNHILKAPYIFPFLFFSVGITLSVISCAGFYIGHSEVDLKLLPLNLTKNQFEYFIQKSAASYPLEKWNQTLYPIYMLCVMVAFCFAILFSSILTVQTVREKQTMMSIGTQKHHLKVLKIMIIQACVNIGITCCVPTVLVMTIFVHVNSYIVYVFLIMMGTNSFFHSVLTIFLNSLSRKTLINLFKRQITSTSVSVIAIDMINK